MAKQEKKAGESAAQEKAVKYFPVRKITVATVHGKIRIAEVMGAPDQTQPIMDLWGVAAKARDAESDYGSYVRFLGQFRAVDLATGKRFKASVCLLPKFLEEELRAMMGDGAANAEFGLRLSARFDEEAGTKYVYVAEPIVQVRETDQLAALTARMESAQRPALPAPQ